MTAQTRPVNIGRFEQGDSPQGSDFLDLIDSFVSLADTTAQAVTSDLRAANFVTPGKVSAATLNIGTFNASTVSGATVVGASASFTGLAVGGAAAARIDTLHVITSGRFAGTLEVVGKMTAAAAMFSAVVSATSMVVSGTAQFTSAFTITSGNAITPVTASVATGKVLPFESYSVAPPNARGYIKIRVDGTVACVPFWYSST